MCDTWYTMHGVIYSVIVIHIMCSKVVLSFSSYVDTTFGSGVGGGFEVVFEY